MKAFSKISSYYYRNLMVLSSDDIVCDVPYLFDIYEILECLVLDLELGLVLWEVYSLVYFCVLFNKRWARIDFISSYKLLTSFYLWIISPGSYKS